MGKLVGGTPSIDTRDKAALEEREPAGRILAEAPRSAGGAGSQP